MEHGFALYHNLWTWNGFYLGLKFSQAARICYAVSVLLANIWTYLQKNQTSQCFGCAFFIVKDYLALLVAENSSSEEDQEEGQRRGIEIDR